MDHFCALVFLFSDFKDSCHYGVRQLIRMMMWARGLSRNDLVPVSTSSLTPLHNGALSISEVPSSFPGAVPGQYEVDRISSDLRQSRIVGVWHIHTILEVGVIPSY